MGKPSHIPLFPDAYLRDNYRLTLEQHGLFLLLMMEAWNRPGCELPSDDQSLAQICQVSVAKFRKISAPVLQHWTKKSSTIFQKRLKKEWAYVQEKSAKRRGAAMVRWDANAMQMDSNCNASAMHLGGGGGGGGGLNQEKSLLTTQEGACDFDGEGDRS